MVSTVDPEARHVHKSVHRMRDGYKGHVALEPTTGLFTAVALRRADGADNHDAAVAEDLLADEDRPRTVLGDSAYGTAGLRESLEAAGHEAILKPPPLRPAVPGGFTSEDFLIDWETEQVTCPAGHTRPLGKPATAGHRQVQFKPRCTGCPLRERCTTSKTGRVLTVHSQHQRLADARAAATAPAWQHEYRTWRPLVERGIAWLTHGSRRLRYRGAVKNDAWLHLRAAALNLRRPINLGLDHRNDTWTITTATA